MRVFVLVNPSLSTFHQKVLGHLLADESIEIVGGLIDTRPKPSGFRKIKRELKRGRGGYILVQVFGKLFSRSNGDGESVDASGFFASATTELRACTDLYADDVIEFVRSCKPDVVFRAGFGIIKEPWLSIAPLGILSYHHGNLRCYRGQPVGFWEVYDGAAEMGVTLQRLNARLDAGAIIREMMLPIEPGDSWSTVYRRAYDASDRLAVEALRALADDPDAGVCLSDDEMGRVYTTPNLRQWLTMHARVLGRRLRGLFGGSRGSNGQAERVHS